MPEPMNRGVGRREVVHLGLAMLFPSRDAASREKRASVALLMSDLRNPFFAAIARTFEQRFSALSPRATRLSIHSAGFDHARQAEHMKEEIRRGTDIVVVSPIDAELLAPCVEQAHQAGAKVIAVDSSVPGADLTITTDNLAAGRSACEYLVQRLKGRGNVAIIHGPTNTAALDRVRACREVLARHGEIRLVSEMYNGGGTKEGGLERMVTILLGTPRLDGLFAINDPTAIGAELAARQAGRSEMIITSVDGAGEVSRRLREANSLIVATAAQDPKAMGRLAAEGAAQLLRGQPPGEPVVVLAPRLITGNNVRGYRGWGR